MDIIVKHQWAWDMVRDVTDSESDGIDTLFLKSVWYLKSDRVGFEIVVLVQLYKFE